MTTTENRYDFTRLQFKCTTCGKKCSFASTVTTTTASEGTMPFCSTGHAKQYLSRPQLIPRLIECMAANVKSWKSGPVPCNMTENLYVDYAKEFAAKGLSLNDSFEAKLVDCAKRAHGWNLRPVHDPTERDKLFPTLIRGAANYYVLTTDEKSFLVIVALARDYPVSVSPNNK